jgi:hypothetical protein
MLEGKTVSPRYQAFIHKNLVSIRPIGSTGGIVYSSLVWMSSRVVPLLLLSVARFLLGLVLGDSCACCNATSTSHLS